MTAERNKKMIETFYDVMWNRWDMATVRQILTQDIEFRGSIGLSTTGHDGFIEYMNIIRAAFSDFHNEIDAIVAEGEHAAARLTYTGTHEGELLGIAATCQKVSYAGAAFFTFHDNRIAKVWVLGDALSLMRPDRGHRRVSKYRIAGCIGGSPVNLSETFLA